MSFNIFENHIKFIDTQPSLISNNTLNQLNELIHVKSLTLSEKIIQLLKTYWYIVVICIILLIIFIWRYKKIKKNKEKFFYDDLDKLNENIAIPTFNPYLPIEKQNSYVRYLPNESFKGAINNNINNIDYVNTNNMIGLLDNIDDRYSQFQQPLINTGPLYHNTNPNENISDINLQNNRILNNNNLNNLNEIHKQI